MANNGAIHQDNLPSYVSGGTIARYAAVKLDTARNTVVAAVAVTDKAIGIALSDVVVGDFIAVKRNGYALASVGTGGWTKGAKLTLEAGGSLIVTTTAGDSVFAIAQEIAAVGEQAEIYILPVAMKYSSLIA